METFVSLMTAHMSGSTTGPLTALTSSRGSARQMTQAEELEEERRSEPTPKRHGAHNFSRPNPFLFIPSGITSRSSLLCQRTRTALLKAPGKKPSRTWPVANSVGPSWQMRGQSGDSVVRPWRGRRRQRRWRSVPSHLTSTLELGAGRRTPSSISCRRLGSRLMFCLLRRGSYWSIARSLLTGRSGK